VRPLRLDLSGVEEHVHEGAEVVLSCQVTGARPAANITWYNGSEPIGPDATANTHAAVQVSHSTNLRRYIWNNYNAIGNQL
jgi:Immunoglobulin domain